MSSFNVRKQENDVDSKIVVALERLSEAFRVLLWDVSKETSLSPIQLQILVFVLFHEQSKCKVGYLASEFNMTKATISDSVKVLLKKELVSKAIDASDTRSYSISLTAEGRQVAQRAARFASPIEKSISTLPADQKELILTGLLNTIHQLTGSGVITLQRMCFTCANYRYENGQHYCKLLQSVLSKKDLRIDCAEHSQL